MYYIFIREAVSKKKRLKKGVIYYRMETVKERIKRYSGAVKEDLYNGRCLY